MNLDTCTSGQREIITTLDNPLMVSAGAGSGKTFTLTQRVAFALDPKDNGPHIDGIDKVLAITFTTKAAEELKSRIKQTLLGMGLSDQALKVDDAWISTIHGMCSRILREHALEIGLDPYFEVMSETEEEALRQKAFDWVVKHIENDDNVRLRNYVDKLAVRSSMFGADSIENRFEQLRSRADALPCGYLKTYSPKIAFSPSDLMRELIEESESLLGILQAFDGSSKTVDKLTKNVRSAIIEANIYIQKYGSLTFDDEDFDSEEFARVFYGFPSGPGGSLPKAFDRKSFDTYKTSFALLSLKAEAGCASGDLQAGLDFAELFDKAYAVLKGRRKLDNSDLLRKTYDALSSNPAIADAYRDKFKLIMVDEFQDTDALQVSIIDLLAKPGRTNVCTVGDAQQSIYRFRGADVNVFYAYSDVLKADSNQPKFVSLPDNFRSHGDVLSFVESIFSQPDVFGENFLALNAQGAVAQEHDPLFDQIPRISIGLFQKKGKSAPLSFVREQCARAIAKHFATLRENNVSPSDMAILLGTMSNVDIYAQALRDEGFECMVTGGSTFAKASEVQLVDFILRVLANQNDDEALYQVLSSPLFNLSDDVLLHLATFVDAGDVPKARSLSVGFFLWEAERSFAQLTAEEVEAFDFAWSCIEEAANTARTKGLRAATDRLIVQSGWFSRLEQAGARGVAQVGNVQKALRLLDEIEERGLGIARSVDEFSQVCATSKLTPGLLATTSSNFVRIMTVHASKGLEFGHVAVSELSLKCSYPSYCCENINGSIFMAAQPVLHDKKKPNDLRRHLRDAADLDLDVVEGLEAGEHMLALSQYAYYQELEEKRRLLYVALTRAVRSLYVGISFEYSKDNPNYEDKPILHDMHQALGWDASAENSVQMLEYGGSAPCRLMLASFTEADSSENLEFEQTCDFVVPTQPLKASPFAYATSRSNEDVFSYSALPHDPLPNLVDPEQGYFDGAQDVSAGNRASTSLSDDEDATTLGLAFHRLAQYAIETYSGQGGLVMPGERRIANAEEHYELSTSQTQRLHDALDRWFGSQELRSFMEKGIPQAEVPFMVAITRPGFAPIYLEGEIDALICSGDAAWLIDYKTGGSDSESLEVITAKHSLQAKCYAYALLSQGYTQVQACFVRVERSAEQGKNEPQTVTYEFTSEDKQSLEDDIVERYWAHMSA